jgi:hypothetical protein
MSGSRPAPAQDANGPTVLAAQSRPANDWHELLLLRVCARP